MGHNAGPVRAIVRVCERFTWVGSMTRKEPFAVMPTLTHKRGNEVEAQARHLAACASLSALGGEADNALFPDALDAPICSSQKPCHESQRILKK